MKSEGNHIFILKKKKNTFKQKIDEKYMRKKI